MSITLHCTKEKGKTPLPDERDMVIGDYSGIRVHTFWNDTVFVKDTSEITINLSKSSSKKVIDVTFNPKFSGNTYSFLLENGVFTSISSYHPPQLRKSNDSLFFYEKPALGPFWDNCMTKKK